MVPTRRSVNVLFGLHRRVTRFTLTCYSVYIDVLLGLHFGFFSPVRTGPPVTPDPPGGWGRVRRGPRFRYATRPAPHGIEKYKRRVSLFTPTCFPVYPDVFPCLLSAFPLEGKAVSLKNQSKPPKGGRLRGGLPLRDPRAAQEKKTTAAMCYSLYIEISAPKNTARSTPTRKIATSPEYLTSCPPFRRVDARPGTGNKGRTDRVPNFFSKVSFTSGVPSITALRP